MLYQPAWRKGKKLSNEKSHLQSGTLDSMVRKLYIEDDCSQNSTSRYIDREWEFLPKCPACKRFGNINASLEFERRVD